MLTGTKKEEDLSYDNINTILIISTILMVFSCGMEVLMYFLYDNKVSIFTLTIKFSPDFEVSSQKRDGCRARGEKQEENL